MTPSIFPAGEILLLLFILNKSFLLFLYLFHCLFQILIVKVDLGCSCCHLGSLAADRLRDIRQIPRPNRPDTHIFCKGETRPNSWHSARSKHCSLSGQECGGANYWSSLDTAGHAQVIVVRENLW